ncbi:hypothetical protein D3C85_1385280 [compost metagenome]
MLQGIKCLLQPQLAGEPRLDVERNYSQAVVLECDQRPQGVFLEEGTQNERQVEGDRFPVIFRAVPFDVARILNFNQADAVG